jgi:acetylornithine deacetylase
MWFQVKVRGRPVHVAHAGSGANAIEACIPIISALHQLEAKWNAEKHPAFEHLDHPINFVVSKIEGGDWTSSVPAWCTFDMRVGMYPGANLEKVQAEIEATVREASRHDAFLSNHPPSVHYHGFQAEGYVLDGGEEARTLLGNCHQQVTGRALEGISLTATTDARFFGLYADTPALVYGPISEHIHGFDERVDLKSTLEVTK